LVYACKFNNIEIYDFLIKNGADINLINTKKENVLFFSAECGYVELAKK